MTNPTQEATGTPSAPEPGANREGDGDAPSMRTYGFATLAWQRFRRHRLALVAALLLVLIASSAIFAPWLAPYNPNYADFSAFNGPPSAAHPLGSDLAGHDVLSRVLYGGRISLIVGFGSMISAVALGTLLGAVAGYFGGWIDNLIMRVTDAVLSLPLYLLLFVLSIRTAGSRGNDAILLIIGIIMAVSWTYIARLVRGEFLSLREREFIQAARAAGVGPARIILRHLLPNAVAPIAVNATLLVGNSIILESVLSFFGFGVQPPTSSWGSMLSDGQANLADAPWETVYPGLMILITVLSVNLLGDGLRDALDPFSGRQ